VDSHLGLEMNGKKREVGRGRRVAAVFQNETVLRSERAILGGMYRMDTDRLALPD
jgi:hypothetical protein